MNKFSKSFIESCAISADEISTMLGFIDATNRDKWIMAGMAIKDHNDGMYDVWNDWARQSKRHNENAARASWRSFKAGGGITIGSLIDEAKKGGYVVKSSANTTPISADEVARRKAERAEQEKASALSKANDESKAAAKCNEMLHQLEPASDGDNWVETTYTKNKKFKPYRGFIGDGDAIIVPIYESLNNDSLINLQTIQANGDKRFYPKARATGGFVLLGEIAPDAAVLVSEGYATGCSLHESTGLPVVVAFSVGNLSPVLEALREALPHQLFVLCADNDAHQPEVGNVGVKKAAQICTAFDCLIVAPLFADIGTQPTDFNDLHQLEGLDKVNEQVIDAIARNQKPTTEYLAYFGVVDDIEADFVLDTAKPKKTNSPFKVTDGGVLFEAEGEDSLWLCSRLDVIAQTRDNDGNEWGRLLEWHDNDNRKHVWAMPIGLTLKATTELHESLANQGLIISPKRKALQLLSQYIMTSKPQLKARCVTKTGWHNDVFVLPHQTIGESKELAIYQSAGAGANPYSTKGTLSDWRDTVGALCAGNSRCMLAVSMAFAGVLLPLANAEGGGVHMVGDSSKGKSTTVNSAASVYGESEKSSNKRYWHAWRATDNGLEGIAAQHNHGLLILDEIKQAAAKVVSEAAYMLANGAGKARAQRSGDGAAVKTWQLLYLSNGELGLGAHMAQAGLKIHAGQEIRFAEIKADAGAGHGLFEQLHGYEGGAALSDAINQAACNNYGTAGVAFIEHCTKNVIALRQTLADQVDKISKLFLPDGAQGQVTRVCARFALIAVAGELATQWGITGWDAGHSTTAAQVCFNSWLDSRESGSANQEREAMLEAVRTFILKHSDSRFTSVNDIDHSKTINRAGYVRVDSAGNNEYLIIPDVFKKEVCNGLDWSAVCKVLAEKDAIVMAQESGKSRFSTQQRIGSKKTRFYVVKSIVLGD